MGKLEEDRHREVRLLDNPHKSGNAEGQLNHDFYESLKNHIRSSPFKHTNIYGTQHHKLDLCSRKPNSSLTNVQNTALQ